MLSALASSSTSKNLDTRDGSETPKVIQAFLKMTANTLRSAVAARGGRVKNGNKRTFAEFLHEQGVDPATLADAQRVTNPSQKRPKLSKKLAVRSDTEMLSDKDELDEEDSAPEGGHFGVEKRTAVSTSRAQQAAPSGSGASNRLPLGPNRKGPSA